MLGKALNEKIECYYNEKRVLSPVNGLYHENTFDDFNTL